MSEENVEVVRKLIDAFNRGDLDAWLGFLSPEVTWESLPFPGFRDVYRGRAEAREWIEQLLEVFEEAHLEIEEITALSDDRVLIGYTQIARGRGSGLPGELSRRARGGGDYPLDPPGCVRFVSEIAANRSGMRVFLEELVLAGEDLGDRVVGEDPPDRVGERLGGRDHGDVVRCAGALREGVGHDDPLDR
jgi:hypothetical protein